MKKYTLFEDLKHYFKNTPREVLDRDLSRILSENPANLEGPDMLDILPTHKQIKQYRKQLKQYRRKNK